MDEPAGEDKSASSLKFLRKTPRAREKVERLYLRRCQALQFGQKFANVESSTGPLGRPEGPRP